MQWPNTFCAHERGLALTSTAKAAHAVVTVIVAAGGDASALLLATRQRVDVPGQLALLGFIAFAIARQWHSAFSRVCLPRCQVGAEAARSFRDAFRHDKATVLVALPWTLVARGSPESLSTRTS